MWFGRSSYTGKFTSPVLARISSPILLWTILSCLAWLTGTDDRSRTGRERRGGSTRAHEGQGWGGGGCHTVRDSHRSTMAPCRKGQSENKREGHRDNTVSFLRLPALILGDGSAVECGVFHDDAVVDIVLYNILFRSFFWPLTKYIIWRLCVSSPPSQEHNNNQNNSFAKSDVNLPSLSSYNKYWQ